MRWSGLESVKLSDDFEILRTVTGIGVILAMIIMLETGAGELDDARAPGAL